MNKHSVALILPYYGKFPNYFPLWLKTAGANRNFTFMIFTDSDMSCYNVPDNVHVNSMTMEEIRQRASRHLGFEAVLTKPYKLCDYRPMFGLIFGDYLKGYDFWGHIDPDIIWGDLNKFVSDELLDKYGKVFEHGHFTLYRNTDEVNHFALHKLSGWNVSYRDVYKISRGTDYDEDALIANLFSSFTHWGGGKGQYYSVYFASLVVEIKQFRISVGKPDNLAALRWIDGKLYGLAINGDPEVGKEYMYLHLHKRAMNFTPGIENDNSFLIIPNDFVKDHVLTQEEIELLMTPDPEYTQFIRNKYKPFYKRGIWELIRDFLDPKTSQISWIKILWNILLKRKPHRYA